MWVGRLWVWGLSIMGETGVRHVMKSLLADFDILMNVGGFQSIEQINKTALGEFDVLLGFHTVMILRYACRVLSQALRHDRREIKAIERYRRQM